MPKTSIKSAARKAFRDDRQARKIIETELVKKYGRENLRAASKTIDSFQNFAAALGYQANNITSASTYGFNPISRVRTLLEWIHRGSWLGGVAIDVVADDMTRAGVDIKGDLDPEQIEQIEERAVTLGVWNSINDNTKWARLYGGSLGVFLIKNQDPSTPLRLETIGKDQFAGLLVLDRWMVEPSLNDLVTEVGPHLGLPKFYTCNSDAPAFRGKKIHYSRCFRLEGIRLPYWQRLMENLWGISVIERLYDRMIAFDSATTGAAQLVYKCYLRTYKIKGLREIIAAGGQLYQGLLNQVALMRQMQSIEGITLLDGEDEFEAHTHQAFSGLDSCLLQFGQQLAGALQIPLVRLFGQSPAGLNSTGESDLRMYYDGIAQQQNRHLLLPVTAIYRAIAQSLGIRVGDGFGVTFRPLWQMTDEQKSTYAKNVTESVTKANTDGLVSDKIALQELRQSSKVSGIWSNITEEDIDAANDVPAPKIDPLMPGEEHAPEEEGDENEADNEGAENNNKSKAAKKAKKNRPTGDAEKFSQAQAQYTEKSKKTTHCGLCKHFVNEPNYDCTIVENHPLKILPQGGCHYFAAAELREVA